jgi:ribonuclease P protein component
VLPSAHRLRRSADFSHVIREGRRTSSPTVVLHTLQGEPTEPTRVGFVVAKNVGNAVMRNQVKRRLRHAVRPWVDSPGLTVVVRATPAAATASTAILTADLNQSLDKAIR